MKVVRFEDLEVWQKARGLTREVYHLTGNDRFSHDYGLRDQMRRASVSIMANIAEGFSRKSDREFSQFLFIAKSSAAELQSHAYVALNWTTQHSYTSSLAVVLVAVRPERSAAKSKARTPARTALFDFAADAATLRANGCSFAQKVWLCANLLCFDLDQGYIDEPNFERLYADLDHTSRMISNLIKHLAALSAK